MSKREQLKLVNGHRFGQENNKCKIQVTTNGMIILHVITKVQQLHFCICFSTGMYGNKSIMKFHVFQADI